MHVVNPGRLLRPFHETVRNRNGGNVCSRVEHRVLIEHRDSVIRL